MCPELKVDMKDGWEGEPGMESLAGDALQEPETQGALETPVF